MTLSLVFIGLDLVNLDYESVFENNRFVVIPSSFLIKHFQSTDDGTAQSQSLGQNSETTDYECLFLWFLVYISVPLLWGTLSPEIIEF